MENKFDRYIFERDLIEKGYELKRKLYDVQVYEKENNLIIGRVIDGILEIMLNLEVKGEKHEY